MKALESAHEHGISRVQLEMDSSLLKETMHNSNGQNLGGIMFDDIGMLLHERFVCSNVFFFIKCVCAQAS
jgi:ribonuclease HI